MVRCVHIPTSISVAWEEDYGASLVVTNGQRMLICPIIAEMMCSLKATCNGIDHVFHISVLNPSGIICQQCTWGGMELPKGTAGGAGMYLSLYVEPMTVNFEGIALQEVPSNSGTHTGYFAQTNQMASWYHDENNGAGWWHDVKSGNYWTTDNAKVNIKSPPWSFGTKSWDIPVGWHFPDKSENIAPLRQIQTVFHQDFTITSEGTTSVSKFSHSASRTTNDWWFLDGVMIRGEE